MGKAHKRDIYCGLIYLCNESPDLVYKYIYGEISFVRPVCTQLPFSCSDVEASVLMWVKYYNTGNDTENPLVQWDFF